MDVENYRKDYLEKLDRYGREQSANKVQPETLTERSLLSDRGVDGLIAVAGDGKRSVEERLGAIDAINNIAFDQQAFRDHNADYVRLLKELRTDRSSKVRLAAFQRLALSLDHDTRNMLQESLSGASEPLLPAKAAATLLGVDDHASSRSVLRSVAENTAGPTQRAALRGLAADASSAPLLERIVANRKQTPRTRETAALSLKVASPKRFVKLAKKLVVDEREDDMLRATAMAALAQGAEVRQLAASTSFAQQLDDVSRKTKSRTLKSSIGRFRALNKSHGL